jgi:hypothetical protein
MDEKLQYLLDRLEIQDVVNRYARGLDRHDDDVLRSVFHEDAVDNHGPWVGGREAFVAWANGPCHGHTNAHLHQITTHNCEIDGDVAHTESYCQWVHRLKDEETVTVGGGRYVDRLEKREGEWRIAARTVTYDWVRAAPLPSGLGAEAFGVRQPTGGRRPNDPIYQLLAALP